MDVSEALAKNLQHYRKKSHFTQDELSDKSGVSQVYISRIESCKQNPTIRVLEQLAQALRVSVSDLLCVRREIRNKGVEFTRNEIAKMLIRTMPLDQIGTLASLSSFAHHRGALDYQHDQAPPKQDYAKAISATEKFVEMLREYKNNGMLLGHEPRKDTD